MSILNDSDIKNLLEEWDKTKQNISVLEKKLEKYKSVAKKIMDESGKNIIETDNFILKKKDMSRTSLTKKDIPNHLWEQYSKNIKFSSYYLNKKK